METELNHNGCTIKRNLYCYRERYYYDERLAQSDGWKQFDTWQDAPYFGVWVNSATRQIMTFAEGDETLVTAPDESAFDAELSDCVEFYSN